MNGHVGEAEAFCERLLPHVSRTFALGIASLPRALRRPTMVGYLFCRVADALEDQTSLPRDIRAQALRAWTSDVTMAVHDGVNKELLGVNPLFLPALPSALIVTWPDLASPFTNQAEHELLLHREKVVTLFCHLPEDARHLLAWQLNEMTGGMQEFLQTAGHYPIATFHQLKRYCYYVAGTVGILLTGLFSAGGSRPLESQRMQVLCETGEAFGIALQLVNVIKDAAGDLLEHRCFLPYEFWPPEGLPLGRAATEREQNCVREILLCLIKETIPYLRDAQRYLCALPLDRKDARRFCALPLHLALHTLAACRDSASLADARHPVKLSRPHVARIAAWVEIQVMDNVALQTAFDEILQRLAA